MIVLDVYLADAFQKSFMRWVEAVFVVTKGHVIAIDGKTARRSHAMIKQLLKMRSIW